MKQKLLKVFAILFAAVFVTGCSGVSDASISGNYDKKCVIDLSAQVKDDNGEIHDIEASMSDRTMLPDPTSFTGLEFRLSGHSEKSEIVDDADNHGYQVITFDAEKSAKVELGYSIWELTLTAYKGDDPVLVGYTTADFTDGGSNLTFILSKGNITTTGSMTITGSYNDGTGADKVSKVVWTLRNFTTDIDVGTPVEDTAPDPDGTVYTKADLAPGQYYLFAKFLNADGKTVGNWGDLVVVDPGLETTGSFGPIDLNKKPVAPSNIKVWSIDASRDKDSYTAKITWDDNSTDEERFIIKITEYTDTGYKGTYTAVDKYYLYMETLPEDGSITTVYTDPRVKGAESQKDIYVSGSLLAGNKEFRLTLPTGRLFDVEVAAVNDIGRSDYGTRVTSTTGDGGTGYSADDKISLFYIDYNLAGGFMMLDNAGTEKKVESNLLEYYCYTGTQEDLMEIKAYDEKASPHEYPYVIRGKNPFNQWVTTYGGHTAITKNLGYNNLTVFADYDPVVVINYIINGYKDIDDGRITLKYSTTEGGTAVESSDLKNKTIALNSDTVPAVIYIQAEVSATATAEDAREYAEYKFYIDSDTLASSGTTNKYEISSKYLASGVHTITISARVANTTDWYSHTYGFKIER